MTHLLTAIQLIILGGLSRLCIVRHHTLADRCQIRGRGRMLLLRLLLLKRLLIRLRMWIALLILIACKV